MDCSFLAGVLATKDYSILITALQIAEMLMQKVPDIFARTFVKEGVVHAIDVLIASDSSKQSLSPAVEKSADASTSGAGGAPSSQRSRRGGSARRRSTGNSNDPNSEEPGGSAATPVGSPPNLGPEPAFRSLRSGLRSTAINAGKHFKEAYFSGDSSLADPSVTESLRKLKSLCAKLNGEGVVEVKGKGKGKAKAVGAAPLNEDELSALISEIFAELGGEDGVSTFEFVGSGIVVALLNYFGVGSVSKDKLSEANLVKVRQETLQRFKQFIELSLPLNTGGKEAPLTMLVRKLQNALASLERFPVVLSHTPRSTTHSATIAGLSALTQPFKLRLSRASNEKLLRDYSSKIVLIEPLATLVAVEDFLWPRVKRHDSVFQSADSSTAEISLTPVTPTPTPAVSAPVAVERRPSTRSRSAAEKGGAMATDSRESEGMNLTTVKGKGKAVSRGNMDSADDHLGPETRNAAAQRRAAGLGVSAAKQAFRGIGAPSESEVGLLLAFSVSLHLILF
jgi:E3 ubiquitin-protein ligase TRIP12